MDRRYHGGSISFNHRGSSRRKSVSRRNPLKVSFEGSKSRNSVRKTIENKITSKNIWN